MEQLQVLDPHDHMSALPPPPAVDYRSNVDTSSPFRSVKEAVAIFGERLLVGEIYSPTPSTFPKKDIPFSSPSPKVDREPPMQSSYSPSSILSPIVSFTHNRTLSDTVKKLAVELEETKAELKLLKEKESETEVALASLNAELHKNMSKLARAEAAVAAKAVAASRSASLRRKGTVDDGAEEEKKRDAFVKMEISGPSPSLAEILSIGEFVGRKKERKVMKKKPIVPLVWELFSRKNAASASHNPLYSSSHLQWN